MTWRASPAAPSWKTMSPGAKRRRRALAARSVSASRGSSASSGAWASSRASTGMPGGSARDAASVEVGVVELARMLLRDRSSGRELEVLAGRVDLPAADRAAVARVDLDRAPAVQVLDRDDPALDGDHRAVAVVLGDPDRPVHRRRGEAAPGAEATVAAAEQAADRLVAARGDGRPRPHAARGGHALREVAAVQSEPGHRVRGVR